MHPKMEAEKYMVTLTVAQKMKEYHQRFLRKLKIFVIIINIFQPGATISLRKFFKNQK